jgi:hypothetical protein
VSPDSKTRSADAHTQSKKRPHTQSDPLRSFTACGMQNVAEMMFPLRPNAGLARWGSSSTGVLVMGAGDDKLIRRRISAFVVAPAAASLGDCAAASILPWSCWGAAVKYEVTSVFCVDSGSYSPKPMPGVTGIFTRDGRRPG